MILVAIVAINLSQCSTIPQREYNSEQYQAHADDTLPSIQQLTNKGFALDNQSTWKEG